MRSYSPTSLPQFCPTILSCHALSCTRSFLSEQKRKKERKTRKKSKMERKKKTKLSYNADVSPISFFHTPVSVDWKCLSPTRESIYDLSLLYLATALLTLSPRSCGISSREGNSLRVFLYFEKLSCRNASISRRGSSPTLDARVYWEFLLKGSRVHAGGEGRGSEMQGQNGEGNRVSVRKEQKDYGCLNLFVKARGRQIEVTAGVVFKFLHFEFQETTFICQFFISI